MQRSRNECDNDFSRGQEKNIFGQLNPGNGIETSDKPSPPESGLDSAAAAGSSPLLPLR
ncbi:MAG: hypothetical protein KME26_17185 [Oscillatoria princeps RMCB-10]|jgi:hypothetical protein|nr:hypothetical protein [Oscillatoria princeps RMCB-10]